MGPRGLIGRYVATDSLRIGRYVATDCEAWYVATDSLRVSRYVATDREAIGLFVGRSLRGDLVCIFFCRFMNVFFSFDEWTKINAIFHRKTFRKSNL